MTLLLSTLKTLYNLFADNEMTYEDRKLVDKKHDRKKPSGSENEMTLVLKTLCILFHDNEMALANIKARVPKSLYEENEMTFWKKKPLVRE